MTETIEICQNGEIQEVKLTPQLKDALEREGAELYTQSEYELKERVEELLYSLVTVTPRGARNHDEVHVQDESSKEASVDYGQPQLIDEADDVQITMIRPDRFTVGWKTDE